MNNELDTLIAELRDSDVMQHDPSALAQCLYTRAIDALELARSQRERWAMKGYRTSDRDTLDAQLAATLRGEKVDT